MGKKAFCESMRPESLSQGRLRSLRTLHEAAAGGLAEAFSALLHSPVEVNLTGVQQLPYGKFLAQLENTTYFSLLRAKPLDDCLLLDVEPSILYPMIDRLLGGGHEDEPPPRRPPSDVELPLAARIVRLFLQRLCLAWRNVADLNLDVIQVETNPRLLRALPADEMVVSVDFQFSVGIRRGMLRLGIPCRAVSRLDAHEPCEAESARPPVVQMPEIGPAAESESTVEISATLAETTIIAAELSSLQVGDIVATETDASRPAVVSVAGEPQYLAKPGAFRGRKSVCITEPVREC